ncbi:UDP-N-acetylmuramate--alanine ligase [Candidatus Kinetoplastibacterium desouzaii TCC079E]|uniref:UDP-N-acetylmuramate--L-alanine ligase n=1 Tax=Candidatus Kinetoplastidibacterium desouzai TCC079E TaxID=1208919 RepID=M1M4I4_9PROT|nr:UDP-N-acetylmuramate--L-alanine ligase [Candidatus Kinetoplastibacterium desouzaii]AGF47120.1 UDP-N-acetylmuramate--alanine ligase [Candidatus Kinetoplastibacterium desouzaii TCC079E]
MKERIKHIHFVGIGGSGMSGIAEVMLNLGYVVSGSDIKCSVAIDRLKSLGIKVYIGHEAKNIYGSTVIVVSSAIDDSNPEIVAAKLINIPIVPRAVMLAELMRFKKGIAIAGTHGKTTTTSLIASILEFGGLDPTYVIGGKLNSVGTNACLGQGEYIVVEADESDGSFLNLLPIMAVVTNIDSDHMSTYDHDIEKLKQSFINFIHRLPFYGNAIVCIDSNIICDVMPFISRPVVTYGLNSESHIHAYNIRAVDMSMEFDVRRYNIDKKILSTLSIKLNLPGLHNVQNALAAIAVATEIGISDDVIVDSLNIFHGVGRRFTYVGKFPVLEMNGGGFFEVIDDYGHHPVEMAATVLAARGARPDSRLVLVFQPHRYTRTRDCFEDFVRVLGTVDVLILTEVYSAGEDYLVAADGRALSRAVRVAGKVEPIFIEDISDLPLAIVNFVRANDLVIVMGAGSISKVAYAIGDFV